MGVNKSSTNSTMINLWELWTFVLVNIADLANIADLVNIADLNGDAKYELKNRLIK